MNRALSLPGVALSTFLIAACLSVCASAAFGAAATPPADAKGGESFSVSLPAAGRHEAVMPVARWGRYSLRSAGEYPTALSVADRRSGVIHRDGEPGRRNGRIDLFLDIGEYKLAVQGARKAKGNVTVTAAPFAYPRGFKPSWLVPLRENRFSLDDMQQAAFWFEVPADTSIYIEACGRNLAEIALWRDGEWLVPTENRPFTAKPRDETPLSGFAFAARIPRGAYMVGLYGGKGRSWANAGGEHPCYLKWGLDPLPAGVRSAGTVSPKGYDEVLLAPEAAQVVVEAADKQRLTAEITRMNTGFVADGWLAGDSIHGKSASPRLRLDPPAVPQAAGWRMLKITAAPGRPYVLQTFSSGAASVSGREAGAWWISSQHSGNPGDQLGASGFVVNRKDGALVAVQADTVGAREVAHRFNLLGGMTAYIWVDADGKYSFAPGGVRYKWKLGRYFLYVPPDYRRPDWNEGSKTLELNRGLHVLTLAPENKGIATFVLGKASLLGGVIAAGKAAVGAADNRAWDEPRAEIRFPHIAPGKDETYDVLVNSQAPELASISARPSPINPDTPLGLWLRPGEQVDIPLKLEGRRRLSVTDVRGGAAPFDLDGKRAEKALEADGGNHKVTLHGGSEARLVILASAVPELLPAGSAPEFPDSRRDALPRFPVLEAGKTTWMDLDRSGNPPYAVRVAEPGLYRIETTGRLNTALSLSDRFRHFTRDAAANGVGRNALLIEYLLPGEYQVTAASNGRSAGRLGLAAYRNTLVEGGALEPGIDNRKFIESFSGASYDIRIANPGRYRLESMGQNGEHALRLEDKDGWPVEPAVTNGARTATLAKGEYRLISLPTPQEGRRIARLTPIVEKRAIKGKGPHPLALNTTLASTWMDKGKGKGDSAGAPAVFTFSLPAPIEARLSVSGGFKASLYRNGADTAVAAWNGNRKASLPMGSYRLLVVPGKKRNLAPYQVSVGTRDLVPGLSYDLTRKETLAVSLGSAGIVELGSQGMLDVTATLLDSDGKTVLASNDDGYLDWNFSISRAMKAGRYFLRVESAEPGFSSTTVFMRALTDTLMDSLVSTGGKARSVSCRLNRHLGVFPLGGGTGDVLACAAQGKSRIGLSLEKADTHSDQWIQVAQSGGLAPTVSIPRASGARYRLKAWSETNADDAISISHLAAAAQTADAKQAASGLSGQPEALGAGQFAWFKVDLGDHAPGHFRAVPDQNPLASVAASATLDSAFEAGSGMIVSSTERYAWVELRLDRSGRFRVKLEPVILESAAPLAIDLLGDRPRVFETRRSQNGVGLLLAETDGADPLAGVVSASAGTRSGAPRFKLRGLEISRALWIGAGKSATVALPSEARRVAVWNSLPPTDGTQPTAKLTWSDLALEDGGSLAPGVAAWNPAKPSARAYHLPKGGARVRVTLPPRSALLLKRSDGSAKLECDFEGEPQTREFQSEAGDLYLLALDGNARFDVAVFAAADGKLRAAEAPLAPGAGRLLNLGREGTSLIDLAAGKPQGLYYRGAARGVDWIGADGRLRPDLYDGAMVGPGGLIVLRHGMGLVKLDLCDADSPAEVMACKWAAPLPPSGAEAIDRSSFAPLHDRANWFAFALKDTQHVNLSAPFPLAAILLKEGSPFRYQEAWERFNWDLPLAPGRYALGIRPFAGASLEGASLASLFRSIPALSERQPFTAYLGPGESRLLRFDVAKKSEFGIGLRMSRETVEARLYDGQGRVVSQGKQEFLKLEPGAYHLWMRVPEGAEGTDVTVNLFGQEAPPNEPPERLVKWILSGAEGSRPETATAQEAEPETRRPEWERFLNRGYYGQRAEENETSREGVGAEGEDGEPEDGYRESEEGAGDGEAGPMEEPGNAGEGEGGDAGGNGEVQGE
jgi:hypothetical protein